MLMIALVYAVMDVLMLVEDAVVAVLAAAMVIAMAAVKALVQSHAVIKDALEYVRKDVKVHA